MGETRRWIPPTAPPNQLSPLVPPEVYGPSSSVSRWLVVSTPHSVTHSIVLNRALSRQI